MGFAQNHLWEPPFCFQYKIIKQIRRKRKRIKIIVTENDQVDKHLLQKEPALK
jgi:hypothetical protein